MAALGERFRAAREARGLSLSDVSEQIRIRSVYLAAIEDENWTSIGAPVYIRGFLRTYARFLGLDPEEVVAAFNGSSPGASPGRGSSAETSSASSALRREPSPYATSAAEPPRRRGSLLLWAAAVVAVVLIAVVAYNEWTFRQQGAPAVAVATASPTEVASATSVAAQPTPTAAPIDAAAAANTLALTLTAPSWLRVTVDGNVSMEGTFPAGTSKTFHGKNALVRIGNAGGVEIRVDGKDVGKLGHSGDVVERSFTL